MPSARTNTRIAPMMGNTDVAARDGGQSRLDNYSEPKPRSTTPPLSPGKPLPSSPLLPFHHESVQIRHDGLSEMASRRVSQLADSSKDDPSKPTHSPREIKRLIGPWNLGKTLGVGSTGRVRKARHILTGQIAAVKIMSKAEAASMRSTSVMQMDTILAPGAHKAGNSALPFGLEREIVIMKIIDHANIIKLFDLWENRGEIYLVLEYVEGGELFNYVVQQGGLDERESFRIFRQLMSAVSYCHMFRVCHRDIKPENILIDSVGNIKLADFGMASREHIGGLNTSCGSPHYAPPEIAYGEAYIGSQVDIWSSGAVLYVMLTGNLPFGNHCDPYDIEAVLIEITTMEPDYGPRISDLAYDLLVRMLLKNPSGRIAAEDVWRHPLMKHYEEVAKTASDPHRWIGGPPKPLTTDDCGKPMVRAEIDRDLLNSLCTLWHLVDPEEMMEKLTEEKPNYEKVIYRNLYQFRKEQEENYSGCGLEHADSDVHHLQRRPIRTQSRMTVFSGHKRLSSVSSAKSQSAAIRSLGSRVSLSNVSSRADILGAKRPQETEQRHSSLSKADTKDVTAGRVNTIKTTQESIGESSQSSRQSSQKSQATEKSYDPFRASSTAKPRAEADHAKVTVLGDDSVSSRYGYVTYAASLRRPASGRAQSEGISSRGSSRLSPKVSHGKKRSTQRGSALRYSSNGSWASTHLSSSSARQFPVTSAKNRRVIRVISAKRPTPPPRPRNPTPLSKKQGYVDTAFARHHVSGSPEAHVFIKEESPSIKSERVKKRELSFAPPDDSQRTSGLWEERTRQASMELSELMDEVFSNDQLASALWDDAIEREKQEEFIRRSFDLPGLRGTGYSRESPEVINKKPEAPPPCENPAKLRSIYDADSIAELTKVKESLEKRAQDLGTNALDPVIGHLGRLLGGPVPISRRISSAPGPSRQRNRVGSLSPVREEEESRHVSSPVKGKHGSRWGNKSTIRLVDQSDASLTPAPLKIKKKKSSMSLFGNSNSKDTAESSSAGYHLQDEKNSGSSTTLEKIFRRNRSDSRVSDGSVVQYPTAYGNAGTFGQSETSDSQNGKNWFRRSHMPTTGSPLAQEFGHNPVNTKAGYTGGSSNTTSDELPFRLPKPESAASKVVRFFTRQPKEKRMQIALPDDDADWFKSQSSGSYPYEASSSQSFSSRLGSRDASNPAVPARLSRVGGPMASDRRRLSSFALSSSPHLFSTTLTTQPQFQPSTPTNLFARLFNIPSRQAAPTPHIICLHLPRVNAINEIRLVLRDWRQYGLCNVRVHKKSGTVHATVSENNRFHMLPVSIVTAVHAVAVDGNAGGLSIVKITSEWGNRSSFTRACESLDGVLRGRNLVVREKHVVSEMKKALRDWERL